MTGMMDFGMDSTFPARLGLEEIASPGDESAHSNLGENGPLVLGHGNSLLLKPWSLS